MDRQKTSLKYLNSKEKSKQDDLYFLKRRVKVDDPSEAENLNRIESQDFKVTSKQKIEDNMYKKILV